MRKVYIYISFLAHTYQYCPPNRGITRCDAPHTSVTMDGMSFCLHRYIVTYASGLCFCWTPGLQATSGSFLDAGWRKWCRSSPKCQQQLPSNATFLTFTHLILSGWPLRNSSLACFLACPNFAPCAGSCARPRSSPYSGSAVKGDGNFKIASRIKSTATHHFFNQSNNCVHSSRTVKSQQEIQQCIHFFHLLRVQIHGMHLDLLH